MKTKQLLLCAALTVGAGFPAFADSAFEKTVIFTAVVPSVLELTTNTSSAGVTVADGDYITDVATKTAVAANTLAVRSNRTWNVSARSETAFFTGTGTSTKPCADLSVGKTGGSLIPLTVLPQQIAAGAAGDASGANTFTVDYQFVTRLSTDLPGDYVLSVVYLLTAP